MELEHISVLGAGTMGRGIAHVCALSGRSVRLFDLEPAQVDAALEAIQANLDQGVARGKVSPDDRDAALERIVGGCDLGAAVGEADLVVEAVPERLELKRALLAQVDEAAPDGAIFGTNTSSLSIARIAAGSRDPGRVIGLHFFNPVHIMKLLEIVVFDGTRAAVQERCRAFGASIHKECITVRDAPGFATSRLGVCLGMEAIRMVEQGVASPEDIDTAMVLGYRHPVGPLKLSDLVGIDVRMHIGEYLADALGNEAFRPPELMRRMVAEGRLGQKTGQGFYPW